ncbi:hypothetical protein HXX76_004410 [Chlamydomonas incerta]|uniref:HECT-type E3 ubiquitin transferase n=1 Tax=Chlamydomonas incerta TaxID=51695 RepID=A0A835TH92_CHLIN|nr:hypothetical protein HXX76_004410 [Chlamydomonas incerta]|eukprot:KAG2440299.1 hypothetical protein HXX76_004410 [Chlamydomonas incerta]
MRLAGLGGATRKEQTRDELLEAVRAERAARSGAKAKVKSAVVIQRAWRGHAARRRLRATLVSEWATSFGPLVAAPTTQIAAVDVAGKLLPPFLFLLKPPPAAGGGGGAGTGKGLAPSAGVSSGAATATAAAVRDAVLLPPAGSPLSNMIRGTLALLLRTCSAAEPQYSYLALSVSAAVPSGTQAGAAGAGAQVPWLDQAWRLLATCCRLVCAPRQLAGGGSSSNSSTGGAPPAAATAGGDPVVDAAALRLAALLTDAAQWRALAPGPGPQRSAAAAVAEQLRSRLALQPQPLFAALSRLLAAQQVQQQAQQAQALAPSPQQQAAQQLQQQQLSRLLGLVLAVLQSALDLEQRASAAATTATSTPAPPGNKGGGGSAATLNAEAAQRCLAAFAQLVLVAPQAVALVPGDMQARLREPRVFGALCRCVRQLLRSRALRGAAEAGWCLTNLLQLLLGPHMRGGALPDAAVTAGGRGGSSDSTASPGAVWVLTPPPDAVWGPGGEAAMELAETAAALMAHMVSSKLVATGQLAAAVAGLWLLGQRGLLLPLLTALMPMPGGVEGFTDMCCAAMDLGGRLATAFADSEVRAAGFPSVLNALAFSPALLPRLWKWLCFSLGLPRECPAAATRGLDVAALAGGYAGVAPRKARVLGLFCRVYAQLLLVLDDGEFYDLQQPLELAASRAVGTSLNSLVFHTYLPKPPPDGSRPPPPPAEGDPAYALLVEWAPRLLRALYERDVRRPYCQSLLWLAPYTEMFGTEDQPPPPPPPRRRPLNDDYDDDDDFDPSAPAPGPDPAAARIGPFTAGTVLTSLMYGGTSSEDDHEGGGGAGSAAGVAAAPALQTKAGEGCRPSSMAALMKATPQAVPFSRRVDLLRALLAEDKARGRWDRAPHAGGMQPIKVTIRRASLIEDAYAGLAQAGSGLKARLQVTFINEAGMTEAGLDFGGLQKELLERVVSAGLDANYGLFTSTPDGLAYPNPAAERIPGGLALLEFMGLMFGKALYEGILLPVPFAHFFVARLQGRQPLFDDLATLDPELHKNLLMVKRYEGDVADLCLSFSAETDYFGTPVHHELLPGRGDEPVTNDSRLLYCHLLADWHLNGKLGPPAAAFARGLFNLIPQASLRLFNPREFNQLLSGAAADGPGGAGLAALDVADMRRYAKYSGGYKHDSTTVKLFWRVVAELTPAEQAALLRFVTSCSRPPLGGFRYLQPPLTLHKVDCDAGLFAAIGGRDVDRLPSASTCYNMLKLPNYRRAATLKTKLLYSITSGAGFELS